MSNYLFSIDTESEEIIVSESPKGSNKIHFIERISRRNNEVLFNSVVTLTSITKSPEFILNHFKSIDKVCQMVYKDFKGKTL
jgi:hypothetical protein